MNGAQPQACLCLQVGEIESSYEDGSLPKALIDVGHHSEHLSIVYQEQVCTRPVLFASVPCMSAVCI